MNRSLYNKEKVFFAVLAVLLSILLSSQAFAAVAPTVAKLLTVPTPGYPNMAAADPSGAIFVGDFYSKSVHTFNPDGTYRGSIALSGAPTAVAVSPSNQLYVGQAVADSGYIEVFSLDGISLSKINGFTSPVSISFLGNDAIFVVDGHQLLRLNSAQATVAKFGGVGTFVEPKSVAVSAQSGEVYVLDRGQLVTATGDQSSVFMRNTPVWRVQVFNAADIAAGPVRSFSNYGFGLDGKIGSASSLAVDANGRIYISDNAQNIVAVFDAATGAFLSTVSESTGTLNPIRLVYNSSNSRLYLTSGTGKYVSVFGIDSFASLTVSPAALSVPYQAAAGDVQKQITFTNTGSASLNWSATVNVPWLKLSQAGGQISGNSAQSLAVSTVASETAGFAPGSQYSAVIAVSYNGGASVIPVTVSMVGAPVITVSPAVINITKKIGEAAQSADVAVTIANDVTGSMAWKALANVSWLGVSNKTVKTTVANDIVATTTTAQVNVSADPANIVNRTAGSYIGKIDFSAAGAEGSPASVTVNLTVVSSGRVTVTTDNKDAKFTITGPTHVYYGSGTSYAIDSADPGDYSVTFDRINGFRSPASQTKTLGVGQEIAFDAKYTDLRRKMSIVASHGAGAYESSEVAVFAADGTLINKFTPFTFKYGANTAVGDVDGDGVADIVVGGGNKVPAVKGFQRDGTPISGLAFTAFSDKTGVVVATGDFDGDGKAEIVAGDALNATSVRIFSYDKAAGAVSDTGVYLDVYAGQTGGVNIAVADVNGDGLPELIASRRTGTGDQDIKVFRINTSGGAGSWTAEVLTSFVACTGAGKASAIAGSADATMNLCAADINGDGVSEIMAVCNSASGPEVRMYALSGELLGSLLSGSRKLDFVAGGDLNMDGAAELVLGDGQMNGMNSIKIYNSSGQPSGGFNPFANSMGVKVTVGNLGY